MPSAAFPVLLLATLAVVVPASARAQPRKFEILDNSFLVEEAFNQEKGVVQNIFSWARNRAGEWEATYTQEWPIPAVAHQFSYTVPFSGDEATSAHVGAVLVNYRFQVLSEAPGRPAFAPRVSVMLPTGTSEDASDRPGLQVNLPFSKQVGDVYLHGNAGFAWLQGVPRGPDDSANLTSPQLAASLIWSVRPLLNLMMETVVAFDAGVDANLATSHRRTVTWSPGLRGGWNLGEKQIVVGAAVPISFSEGERTVAFLTYLSFELPFMANR